MRRKLNVKLVAIVLAGLLVFGVGAHFLHAFQLRQNAYRLLERGDQALVHKDFDKALNSYAQYLTFVPGDVDTLQKYAEVLDVRADASERVELVLKMEQVLRAKPNQKALRMRLVHNLISLDRFNEAIDNLRKLQDSWADKAEISHMLGWCYDAIKNYPQAARSFEGAIRINPQQIRSYALLAEVQQDRMNDPDAAHKTMDDLVQANPDAYQAYLLRGRFLRRLGDDKAAASDLDAAYRLGPNQAEVLLEAADAARARGNWEEATRLLKNGMKRFPDNADFVRQIVSVEILAGKTDAAIENLRAGIQRAPRSYELAILLIDLLIDQKQFAEARAKIDELIKAGLKPTLPNYLKARLLIGADDLRAAIKLLEEVRQDLGPASEWSGRVNVLLGHCYRRIGEHEQELQAFRRAVRDEPTWGVASIELGSALLSNGRLDEGLQTLEPMRLALELPPGYWILLSRARLQRQIRKPASERRWEDVEEALTKADAAEPGIEAAIVRAEMLAARGDFDAARAVLEKARAQQVRKEWPKAALLSAAIFELQGQIPAAIEQYSRAVDLGDMPAARMAHFLELLVTRREFSKAETALTKFEQKQPLTRDLARLGADIAIGLRDNRYAALAVLRAEQAVPTPVRDYRDAVWLAHVYQAAGQTTKAEKVLRESLERDGHAPDVWVAWLEFLTRTNQRDKAAAEIDKMKRILPSARQPLALARCYEALWQSASAGKAFQSALAAAPDDVATLARAADFFRRADQAELAEKWYRRLLEPALLAPAEYVIPAHRHLAVLLAPRDRTQALGVLDQNKQTQGESGADQRVRWFIQSMTASARPDAIGKFEESLRQQPPTPDERLLLARMLESAGNVVAARDQLAEAVDEAPHEAYFLTPYIRVLIRAGDLDDAGRQLARLEGVEPGSSRASALRRHWSAPGSHSPFLVLTDFPAFHDDMPIRCQRSGSCRKRSARA